MGNKVGKVLAQQTSKQEHYNKLSNYLENSQAFRNTALKVDSTKRSFIDKVFKSVHDSAFSEEQASKDVRKIENSKKK